MRSIKYTSLFLVLWLCVGAATQCAQAQQSLYNDLRAHKVGDVITVVLAENISGKSTVSASTDSKTKGHAKSGIGSNFLPISPEFEAGASMIYNSDESARAKQSQLLHGTLSVRIKDIEDNGSFFIAGKRSMEINGERYNLTLKGYIRPADITPGNRVLSYRIADAKITYLKQNSLDSHLHKPGLGRKLLWGLLGIATAATVFMVSK